LNGFLSRANSWTYGMVLGDDLVASGSYSQMLGGIDSNFIIHGLLAYDTSKTGGSPEEYWAYGDIDDGPSRISPGTSWNIRNNDYVIAHAGDLITVTYNNSNNTLDVWINNGLYVDLSSSTYSTDRYPATHDNPTIRIGDFSFANGVTDHPIDYNRIGGWYARLDSLFIWNNKTVYSSDISEISTDRADLMQSDNFDSFTSYIKFTDSNVTVVRGDHTLSTGTVTF